VKRIRLAEANVLHLDGLPGDWRDYDLIVSASMLEYVPREDVARALHGLRDLLKGGGRFVLFITRRNPFTRVLIGRWWQSNLYSAPELVRAFQAAGFSRVRLLGFPPSARYLSIWGHVVEAER
jgi:cyclopropane fatty-acyl-phospholipid synthase-like methyltransferase